MSRFAGVLFVLAACSGPTVVGDLAIDSVVPNRGPSTAATLVRIEGKNFERPVVSNLDNGATNVAGVALSVGDTALTDARWIDDTTLEGTVPAGMALGVYDVTVRLGARSAVVNNGYTVSDTPVTSADAGVDAPSLPSPYAMTGTRWELPCVLFFSDHSCTNGIFQGSQQQLTGLASEHWKVTVRIRGVMENNTFGGGVSTPDGWYEGGLPTDTNENFYGFTVSSPAQVYYLNRAPTIASGVTTWDYQATFLVDGDATITYAGGSQDIYEWDNYNPATGLPYVIAGVTTSMNPFRGQFAHLEVMNVVPAP